MTTKHTGLTATNTAERVSQNTEKAQERLRVLHTVKGMKWDEIAALREYRGIPPGTLSGILSRGYIPPKWHGRFGIRKDDRDRYRVDLGKDLGPRAAARAAGEGKTLTEWVRELVERGLAREE